MKAAKIILIILLGLRTIKALWNILKKVAATTSRDAELLGYVIGYFLAVGGYWALYYWAGLLNLE